MPAVLDVTFMSPVMEFMDKPAGLEVKVPFVAPATISGVKAVAPGSLQVGPL